MTTVTYIAKWVLRDREGILVPSRRSTEAIRVEVRAEKKPSQKLPISGLNARLEMP
jgi:hypothetical protein